MLADPNVKIPPVAPVPIFIFWFLAPIPIFIGPVVAVVPIFKFPYPILSIAIPEYDVIFINPAGDIKLRRPPEIVPVCPAPKVKVELDVKLIGPLISIGTVLFPIYIGPVLLAFAPILKAPPPTPVCPAPIVIVDNGLTAS